MGDTKGWSRFPTEMYGMRTSDYDSTETGRKKYKRFEEKGLKSGILYDIVDNRDTIFFCPFKGGIPCSHISGRGPKDQKEVQDDMNKYELAVVVSDKNRR